MSVEIDRTAETIDLDRAFYDSSYKATVKNKDGRILAECEGSCNCFEDKYRYTYQTRATRPSESEIGEMLAMKLGRTRSIEGIIYWQDKVENMNRLGLKNTIQKMAQKRAMVGAILIATGASSVFTQDLIGDNEDIDSESMTAAMNDLKAVTTPEELGQVVKQYEKIYNADTDFTKAAKELRDKFKTTKK